MRRLGLTALLVLSACSSAPERTEPVESPPSAPRAGGYYKDDGPGDNPPPNLSAIPDAEPRREPLHRWANRPYTVFGKGYTPMSTVQPYKEQGIASWYGKKFHGQKTSSGEIYDMYKMSAAHKTLPIPSYARVTNLANGRSVVVRINDRGPFHSNRIIDLSYAAAHRLGYITAGSARVEVESVLPPGEGENKAGGGVFVQVGAFSSRGNAEDLRAKVAAQLAALADKVEVLSLDNLWRLHVGPYDTQDAARAVAQSIEAELNLKGFLVVR
ncbi:MAG TPA: septal ring lytic transglycosylase RlpA family protein [Burkholderiales bacterium]|nr:septal ring lytic transglycosylase RlpA family protein [Burkholderiales bacterium]